MLAASAREVRRAARADAPGICHDKPHISDNCIRQRGGCMARRWWIPLMALPVVAGVGSLLAVGVASASPGLAHPAKQPAAAHPVSPGSPMIWPSGVAVRSGPNARNVTVSSNNWSGYALSRGRGAFRGVSASWIQPRAQCAGVAGHRYAAFWVGLDGFSSHSVEQTGT